MVSSANHDHDAPTDAGIIRVQGVSKSFRLPNGDLFEALAPIDLEIKRGSFTCLVGPSGCGKSTLLNLAAGLLRPTTGRIEYAGEALRGVNIRAGYITQNDNLLPWRTLERNVAIGLELRGVKRKERGRLVEEALARVGLAGFGKRYPSQLSGGMRKRATLARTLIYQPETLLMDEPFAAVDAQLRANLQQDLLRIWMRDGVTVVFVTHDIEEALLLGDQVVVFGSRPGRILHVEQVSFPRPRDVFALRHDHEFNDKARKLWSLLAASGSPSAESEGP